VILASFTPAWTQQPVLEGEIVDAVTGAPIPGAVVEAWATVECLPDRYLLLSLPPREIATDAHGRYRFPPDTRPLPCSPSVYRRRGVTVLAPGYRERWVSEREWLASLERLSLHRLTSRRQLNELRRRASPGSGESHGLLWHAAVAKSYRVGPASPRPPGVFVTAAGATLDQVVAFEVDSAWQYRFVMARDERTARVVDGRSSASCRTWAFHSSRARACCTCRWRRPIPRLAH
jgi:hypothetical protein